MRYLPPKYRAGFARHAVNSYRREPCPPARITASVSRVRRLTKRESPEGFFSGMAGQPGRPLALVCQSWRSRWASIHAGDASRRGDQVANLAANALGDLRSGDPPAPVVARFAGRIDAWPRIPGRDSPALARWRGRALLEKASRIRSYEWSRHCRRSSRGPPLRAPDFVGRAQVSRAAVEPADRSCHCRACPCSKRCSRRSSRARSPSSATSNCSTTMPGIWWRSRSSSTAGVMTPRSSATIGSWPSAFSIASKIASPGPGIPGAVARRARFGRHRPVRLEAAKMVDADDIRKHRRTPAAARSTSDSRPPRARPSRTADCPIAGRPR